MEWNLLISTLAGDEPVEEGRLRWLHFIGTRSVLSAADCSQHLARREQDNAEAFGAIIRIVVAEEKRVSL